MLFFMMLISILNNDLVSAVGSITVSPEVMPGAERIAELREKIQSLDATCVFSEPQFEPKLVATVTENTNAGNGALDPLGLVKDGPELYFTLIRIWQFTEGLSLK